MAFTLVRDLVRAGKVHARLVGRIRMLGGISLILLAISTYLTIEHHAQVWVALVLAVLTFTLGLTFFSKMNKLAWDEEQEVVATQRMDIFGFVIIGLYIAFEIGLHRFLDTEFGGTGMVTAYLFAAIGASLLGRTIGTLIAIQQLMHREHIVP